MPLSVLFLPKYAPLGASSRYRIYQYLPYYEQQGIRCTVSPLFPDRYLERLYRVGRVRARHPRAVGEIARWEAQRCATLFTAGHFDAVYLQYESLPYLPVALEAILFRTNARVIVDYDDPVTLNYEAHSSLVARRILSPKIPWIVQKSRHVVVGNRHLAKWSSLYNQNVTTVPTSVDLARYPSSVPPGACGRTVIGWIGIPMTAPYLRQVQRSLQRLRRQYDFVLKVIGAPNFTMPGIDVQGVPWTEATEIDQLRSCDIGIMPLADDPWSRGKSALKLIQYLASGVAAVASPIGANCDVVRDSENGFLAASEDAWTEKLAMLIERPDLRLRLAEAGRKTVEERFSIQANAPVLAGIIRQTAGG